MATGSGKISELAKIIKVTRNTKIEAVDASSDGMGLDNFYLDGLQLEQFIADKDSLVGIQIADAAGIHNFETNHYYRKGAIILLQGALYRAKNDFTSGAVIDGDDWEQIPGGKWGTFSGNLADQTDLVNALDEKADKIAYPQIPFSGSFDIDPPRIIKFDTAKTPDLDVSGVGGTGFFAWQVLGHANWLFGFWKDTIHRDNLTRGGLFELVGATLTEIESIYNGTQWLDLSYGIGVWKVNHGIHSGYQQLGTLSGFSPAQDITIPAMPTENLADVAARKQEKIQTVFGNRNPVIAEGDGGIDASTFGLDESVLSDSAYKLPISRVVAHAIDDETSSRQKADAKLQALIDTQAGRGGALSAYDFGSDTPTAEELTLYACQDIWGTGGTWTWDSIDPANSSYVVDDVTHKAGEIFNNTWVRNTYNDLNHKWILTNTPDTNPAVFSWADVGQDIVAQASDTFAGVAKLYNDLDDDNTDGSVTQAAIAGMLSDVPTVDAESDEKKVVHRRGIFAMLGAALTTLSTTAKTIVGAINELAAGKLSIQQDPDNAGKAMIITSTGELAPGVSGKVDSVNGIPPDENKNVQTDYIYLTEADFEAAKDSIPVGATVIKMYEYPDNGYLLNRPDLWPVNAEIDFGQGLYGRRSNGSGAAYAAYNEFWPFYRTNIFLVDCGGLVKLTRTDGNVIAFPIGKPSYGSNISSMPAFPFNVGFSIESLYSGPGQVAVVIRCAARFDITAWSSDVWITYKK
jgi:hypothetical protein